MGSDEKLTHRDSAVRIVGVLREKGYTAYLAGGCVRDALLGVVPKDYDVATDAPPEAVKRLFHKSRYVGESFGVVLVRLDGFATEVATFRTEWGYVDGRRPTRVHFSDAEHDAQRRDFTINGLFEDPLAEDPGGRIIDFVGGRADLEAGVIRAIGHPDERFAEDYLRMLRAVRFAARLGFSIHADTAAAIRARADHLRRISRERIGQEVMWMLSGRPSHPAAAARWMQELGLDAPTLDEAPMGHGALVTLDRLGRGADYATALAAWMIDRHVVVGAGGDGAGFEERLRRFVDFPPLRGDSRLGAAAVRRWRGALCLSNDDRDAMRETLELVVRALGWAELGVAGRKRLLARGRWPQVKLFIETLGHVAAVGALHQQIIQESAPLLAEGVAPEPWVDGNDLIGLGLRPGPRFAELLEKVYDAQLDGTVGSRDEALGWVREKVG